MISVNVVFKTENNPRNQFCNIHTVQVSVFSLSVLWCDNPEPNLLDQNKF